MAGIWREARGTLWHFFFKGLPIFAVITTIASTLAIERLVAACDRDVAAGHECFSLTRRSDVASLRKGGILLFLNSGSEERRIPLTGLQILTGVYLAGVLVLCLVTALTIAREQSWRFAGWLIVRQMAAAIVFSLVLAWAAGYSVIGSSRVIRSHKLSSFAYRPGPRLLQQRGFLLCHSLVRHASGIRAYCA